jgi:hypothetical protein
MPCAAEKLAARVVERRTKTSTHDVNARLPLSIDRDALRTRNHARKNRARDTLRAGPKLSRKRNQEKNSKRTEKLL